jgi:glyoxylate/hydroxypyruvate reductase A
MPRALALTHPQRRCRSIAHPRPADFGYKGGRTDAEIRGKGGGMALLIINLDKMIGNAQLWRDAFAAQLPDLDLRIWPDAGRLEDIEYLAFIRPDFDALPPLPNLKAMFSRSAGVEAFVDHPKRPKVPLGKLEPPGGDPMMTEYTVMHVLRLHREMPKYEEAQKNREWLRTRILRPEERRIGFLGLGLMAKAPALVLKSLGFPVSAWVRSPREDGDIRIFHGAAQLQPFLAQTDIAVCLLPLTRETEGILGARNFAAMPKGAMVINIGRGKHVVEADLMAALDSGQLSHAALDALQPEPLPPESPLWAHPKVTVMPHVARRPTVPQLVTELAKNLHSLQSGGRLLQEIDPATGY